MGVRNNTVDKVLAIAVALLFTSCLQSFRTYAFGWQNDGTGWWYGLNQDNTKYYNDGWHWIDGNDDGISECYYFLPNGYIFKDIKEKTPDGYEVNLLGMWTVDNYVQMKFNLNEKDRRYLTSGLSVDAANMIYKSKAHNIVYDETKVEMFPYYKTCHIKYSNGLEANYGFSKDAYSSEQWYFGEFDPQNINESVTTSVSTEKLSNMIYGLDGTYSNNNELMTRVRELGYKDVNWSENSINIGNYNICLDVNPNGQKAQLYIRSEYYIRKELYVQKD